MVVEGRDNANWALNITAPCSRLGDDRACRFGRAAVTLGALRLLLVVVFLV